MPYPSNVATAVEVEEIVRSYGAVPATIGIIDGQVSAGLTPDQLETLGKAGSSAQKCSRYGADCAHGVPSGGQSLMLLLRGGMNRHTHTGVTLHCALHRVEWGPPLWQAPCA